MKRVLLTVWDLVSHFVVTLLFISLCVVGFAALCLDPWVTAAIFLVALVSMIIDRKFNDKIESTAIPVKYFRMGLPRIAKISVGDWVDLRAAETIELKAGEYALIPLGVGMILPEGYEAHILPRSSTPENFGIMSANSMGVIDNSYCGNNDEWKFPAIAIRDTVIQAGDRIAQFRIVKNQPNITFYSVPRLRNKSRGGIGSTGTR